MATTAELEAKVAELERRLAAMEADKHPSGLVSLIDTLFPADVRTHMRAARKEQLMAMRSFLDHWIEKVDEPETSPRRRESISVD